jgi:uncharacterized protein
MTGENNLQKILATAQPILHKGRFVFCTTINALPHLAQHAQMFFKEQEGVTYILEKEYAVRENLAYTFECSWITLSVHTALDAVGVTATIAKLFTQYNISCNVVAAYYHDHIFVEVDKTEKAIAVLQTLKDFNTL